MSLPCRIDGCKISVPPELELHQLCLGHFTLQVERACNEMRLQASQAPSAAQRDETIRYIADQGSLLAKIAMSTPRLPDEQKARILSTFLTLMNLRESIERAATRAGSSA